MCGVVTINCIFRLVFFFYQSCRFKCSPNSKLGIKLCRNLTSHNLSTPCPQVHVHVWESQFFTSFFKWLSFQLLDVRNQLNKTTRSCTVSHQHCRHSLRRSDNNSSEYNDGAVSFEDIYDSWQAGATSPLRSLHTRKTHLAILLTESYFGLLLSKGMSPPRTLL